MAAVIDSRQLQELRTLAARQHGLVAKEQLTAAGVSAWARSRLRRSGFLVPTFPGVYALKGAYETRWQRQMGAAVWKPDGAVGLRSAAEMLNLEDVTPREDVDLTVPKPPRRPAKGVRLHACAVLPEEDLTVVNGVRVTTAYRTLADLAGELDEVPLAIALESAWRRRAIYPDIFAARLSPGGHEFKAKPLLRELVRDCQSRPRPFASALEVTFWRALHAAGLTGFSPLHDHRDERGHPLEIDFAHQAAMLAVETRGFKDHGSHQGFNRNAKRTSRLTAEGWAVMPVSWMMMQSDPEEVMRQVRDAVAARLRAPGRTVTIVHSFTLPDTLAGRFTSP